MALEPSNPPAEAVRALHGALAGKAARATFSSPGLMRASASPDVLSISMPHRMAYLPLEAIKGGIDLRDVAKDKSWRFLVHEKRAYQGIATDEQHLPIAAATAVGEKVYNLGEINEGPFVAGTVKAITIAEELDEVRKGRFEAVFLIVPAVYVAALWLQNLEGGADIILPMPPSNAALSPYQPMTAADFVRVLERLKSKMP